MSTPWPPILVLDPDTDSRTIVRILLEHEGCTVCESSSPDDALRIVATSQPSILVTEFPLVTADGRSFVAAVRALSAVSQPYIFVVTALALPPFEAEALRAGADRFIAKPIDVRCLAAEIGARGRHSQLALHGAGAAPWQRLAFRQDVPSWPKEPATCRPMPPIPR